MKKVLVIVLSILLYSCSNDDAARPTQSYLKVGECLVIEDKEYELCVESINDSRCPTGAKCFWEGDAVVEFYFKSNGENKSFTLHTNEKRQQDTLINNLKIKLLNVSPYPVLNSTIDQSDYSVELRIFD